eukprot:Hpha_TRINITY_DN23469_c0_g1::TRINITY_DN23469_c0_g1_i1::g.114055::m.114055
MPRLARGAAAGAALALLAESVAAQWWDDWSHMPYLTTPTAQCSAASAQGLLWVIGGISPVDPDKPNGTVQASRAVVGVAAAGSQWVTGPKLPRPISGDGRFALSVGDDVYVFADAGDPCDTDCLNQTGKVCGHWGRVFVMRSKSNKWEVLDANPPKTYGAAAVYCPREHAVYVMGGTPVKDWETTLHTGMVYDIAAGEWSDAPPMPGPRKHSAAATGQDFLVIYGGRDAKSEWTTTFWMLADKETGWVQKPDAPKPATKHPNAAVVGSKLWIYGDEIAGDGSLSTYNYDFDVGLGWLRTQTDGSQKHLLQGCGVGTSGFMYYFGGMDGATVSYISAHIAVTKYPDPQRHFQPNTDSPGSERYPAAFLQDRLDFWVWGGSSELPSDHDNLVPWTFRLSSSPQCLDNVAGTKDLTFDFAATKPLNEIHFYPNTTARNVWLCTSGGTCGTESCTAKRSLEDCEDQGCCWKDTSRTCFKKKTAPVNFFTLLDGVPFSIIPAPP